jgi:hypothetical protein
MEQIKRGRMIVDDIIRIRPYWRKNNLRKRKIVQSTLCEGRVIRIFI